MGALDKLREGKVKPKQKPKDKPKQKPKPKPKPKPAPAPVAEENEWSDDAAPWANPDCVACEGVGFDSKGKACRICKSTAEERGAVSPDQCEIAQDADGDPIWRLKPGVDDGEQSVNGTVPPEKGDEPEEPKKAPAETKGRKKGSKQPTKPNTETETKPKASRGRKPMTYLMAVNVPVWSKGKRQVVQLHEFLWDGLLGQKVADGFGEERYRACDVFKRREAARALADNLEVLAELKGKILHVLSTDADTREVFSAFLHEAEEVIGAV